MNLIKALIIHGLQVRANSKMIKDPAKTDESD